MTIDAYVDENNEDLEAEFERFKKVLKSFKKVLKSFKKVLKKF